MAKYEDYLPGGPLYTGSEEAVIEEAITNAGDQQAIREESTPEVVNWEDRYKNLEVAYSRQGQQMGDYRKLIDDYVSTPEEKPSDTSGVSPITPDDIYENPDEAVRRAVDSHPAIKRAAQLEQQLAERARREQTAEFDSRHPNFNDTLATPEFANWVNMSPMRLELAKRADGYDMTAADALFTLWEAEHAPSTIETQSAAVEAASLEQGFGSEPPAPDRYSRSAMLQQKIRAKQGDMEADAYVKAHATAYRQALGQGLVRD